MNKFLAFILVIVSLVSFYGCGSSGGSSTSPTAAITGTSVVRGQITGTDSVAKIPVYLVKPDAIPATINPAIRGNIQGTWYATTTDEVGKYAFAGVTAGTYNLIAQKDRFHSAVSRNVQVTRASTIDLDVTLTATGDITGKVILSNGMSSTGIFVYIPGTSFMATTAIDGTFTITGIPVGQYALAFWGESIEKKLLANASVVAGAATSVGTDIALTAKTGSSIYLALASPAQGTILYPEDDFSITVNASDSNGQITKVLFQFEDTPMSFQDTTAPFSLSYNSNTKQILTGVGGVEDASGFSQGRNLAGVVHPIKVTAFNSNNEIKHIYVNLIGMIWAPKLIYTGSSKIGDPNSSFLPLNYNYKIIETQLASPPINLTSEQIENFGNATVYSTDKISFITNFGFYNGFDIKENLEPNKKYLVAAQSVTHYGSTKWSYQLEFASPSLIIVDTTLVPPVISNSLSGSVALSTTGFADKFVLEYSSGGASTTIEITATNGIGNYTIPNFSTTATYALRAKTVWKTSETAFSATTIIDPNAVTGVTLNKTTTTIAIGATETLTAILTPASSTVSTVSWTSSNTAVATVDATGKITAVATGTANIIVTTTDGSKTAVCVTTVITGVTFNNEIPVNTPFTDIQIHITGVASTYATTTTLKNTANADVAYAKSTTLSTTAGHPVIAATGLQLTPSAAFQTLTFGIAIPASATVQIKNAAGTVLASFQN